MHPACMYTAGQRCGHNAKTHQRGDLVRGAEHIGGLGVRAYGRSVANPEPEPVELMTTNAWGLHHRVLIDRIGAGSVQ